MKEVTTDFAISYLLDACDDCPENENGECMTQSNCFEVKRMAIQALERTRWIPVSERLPEDLEVVNITWVNHKPEPYYCDIKDKPFTATGIYFKKQWYWWSTVCADYLREYGSNDMDKVDAAIEIIAWCPLPEPYKGESEVEE